MRLVIRSFLILGAALGTLLLALAVPVALFAQTADAPAEGVPVLLWVLIGLSTLSAALAALTRWIPGWGTRLNVAAGVVATAVVALQGLAETNPHASLAAIGMALVGAFFGRERSESRAKARRAG